MSRMRGLRAIFLHSLILFAPLAAAPSAVLAQSDSVGIPEHARAKSYGNGWECDRGYREVDGACTAVSVPANAYPTNVAYGRGWECDRGYQEVAEACAPIEVPLNAYLKPSGDRWKCDRGFREVAEACVAVDVPPNGYLVDSSYGPAR